MFFSSTKISTSVRTWSVSCDDKACKVLTRIHSAIRVLMLIFPLIPCCFGGRRLPFPAGRKAEGYLLAARKTSA